MQFDSNVMKRLLLLDDAALWNTICRVAAENGISLPGGQPSAKDMARLRAILGSRGAGDVEEALAVLRRARREQ
jgi:hypothetical protein